MKEIKTYSIRYNIESIVGRIDVISIDPVKREVTEISFLITDSVIGKCNNLLCQIGDMYPNNGELKLYDVSDHFEGAAKEEFVLVCFDPDDCQDRDGFYWEQNFRAPAFIIPLNFLRQPPFGQMHAVKKLVEFRTVRYDSFCIALHVTTLLSRISSQVHNQIYWIMADIDWSESTFETPQQPPFEDQVQDAIKLLQTFKLDWVPAELLQRLITTGSLLNGKEKDDTRSAETEIIPEKNQ